MPQQVGGSLTRALYSPALTYPPCLHPTVLGQLVCARLPLCLLSGKLINPSAASTAPGHGISHVLLTLYSNN
ncbi:hypothetical protein XENTR_v10019949 [Xenopus tropicalis]|nr:hypothetical protein XENTR_v10019949 [Xenopus tropicalis]